MWRQTNDKNSTRIFTKTFLDYLKSVVEHESEMFWNFNARNLQDDNKSSRYN